MKDFAYCLVSTSEEADTILSRLRQMGITTEELSILLPDKDAIRGAEAGTLVGGAIGGLAGLTALTIPGIGPFLATGPLLAAMGGASIGGALGMLAGAIGAFRSLGLPNNVAQRIEEGLNRGDILISVHSEDPVKRVKTVQILQSSVAKEVYFLDDAA